MKLVNGTNEKELNKEHTNGITEFELQIDPDIYQMQMLYTFYKLQSAELFTIIV